MGYAQRAQSNQQQRQNRPSNMVNQSRNSNNDSQERRKTIGDRSREWMEKKHKKIEEHQQNKKEKELEGCTFQPTFYTKLKQ